MTVGTRGASRRGRAPLLIIAGLVLLIVAGVVGYLARPEPSVGSTAVDALTSAPLSFPSTGTGTGTGTGSGIGAGPAAHGAGGPVRFGG